MERKYNVGFTLIELSIVLVIIGLIVGGVLVGQSLIEAAQIRAQISQIEKYKTAANTFRVKFGYLPGDISSGASGNAAANGLFFETTLGGNRGHGDQNGLIEGGSAGGTLPLGESLVFWRHLSDANLIDGAFGSSGSNAINPANGNTMGGVTASNVFQSLPTAKIGKNNYLIVYAVSNFNYYHLLPVVGFGGTGYGGGSTGLTPIEAYQIDSKIDDGQPNSGAVIAAGIGGPMRC